MSFGGDNQIPELKVDVYNDIPSSELEKMKESAGLVFVSRSGSESLDKKADAYDDGTPHFLALSKNERDMIAYAKEHCGSVILIVNSSNPVELTPVMQGELEVDAIIWAGHPGDQGFRSVADILAGEVNPSGRLVDIFATDFTKTPSYNNWGKFRYTNADKSPFVEYREGMYNGYRYYETAHDIGAAGFVYGELDGQADFPACVSAYGIWNARQNSSSACPATEYLTPPPQITSGFLLARSSFAASSSSSSTGTGRVMRWIRFSKK